MSFEKKLRSYFLGKLPHSNDILISLLQALMGGTTVSELRCELSGDYSTIPRVPHPWPARTKNALCVSLDEGAFEDFHFILPPGLVSTKRPMYFAGAVNGEVATSISLCKLLNHHSGKLILDDELPGLVQCADRHDAEISPPRSVTHLYSLPHS